MKIAKLLLYALVILGALAGLGWFFAAEQTSGGSGDGLAAVVQGPPPGYEIVERGPLSPAVAAGELEALALRPGAGKVGVRFERQGAEIYWLADLAEDLLEERQAGPAGTRLQSVWRGGVRQRLSWARVHGDFTVPGLAPPERRNLYH